MTPLDPKFIDSPESIAAERKAMQDDLAHMRLGRSERGGLLAGYRLEVLARVEMHMAELDTERVRLKRDEDFCEAHFENSFDVLRAAVNRLRDLEDDLLDLDDRIQYAIQTLADDECWKPLTWMVQ